jgi:hypothetical protein
MSLRAVAKDGRKGAEVAPFRSRPYGRRGDLVLGDEWGSRPLKGGDDHEQCEPNCRRRGLWPCPRRLLHVHAELRFFQVGSQHRGVADRVGAPGRGRPHLPGADLPHALRAGGTDRRRIGGDGADDRLPAADPAGPAGGERERQPVAAQSTLRRAPACRAHQTRKAGPSTEEKDQRCNAASSQNPDPSGGSRARLSLAAGAAIGRAANLDALADIRQNYHMKWAKAAGWLWLITRCEASRCRDNSDKEGL